MNCEYPHRCLRGSLPLRIDFDPRIVGLKEGCSVSTVASSHVSPQTFPLRCKMWPFSSPPWKAVAEKKRAQRNRLLENPKEPLESYSSFLEADGSCFIAPLSVVSALTTLILMLLLL